MYSGYAYKVAMDIGRRIAKSFRVVREYDHLFDHWPCRLRMNKYSFTCGVQLHANPGFLTILLQVEIVGGLEVVDDKSGEFVAVDPRPGTLLVNVGDAAKAWSNRSFCNLKHRVQCKEASIRVSIALCLL
ncbi:2-oxoglutarate-dependent dioxygenase DAO [Ziziphus jujuba]|uniref:2-oxoglutarate-dependent dioxygenase DAO n=1 Tax=Ziziphus jujuba TaxID=326968 RepID=A0ABM4AEN4_ZIZJJ|nr:2-oxoglutarate-dependent dioxygenase DAO-like [Ziziphus jujuba var. spinosa]XP_060675198.1 2-oxoglutarate-dependent dioxygenase DAO [Ziziphus jujuba]